MACHQCSFWAGYILLNPLRYWAQSPRRILGPLVRPGDTVLDVGCAMGFFSLEAARLAGPRGRVICVDLRQRFLDILARRAARAGLADRIERRLCTADSLRIDDLHRTINIALSVFVAHEVSDQGRFFSEIRDALKPDGRLLLAEPRMHVRAADFDRTVETARQVGFEIVGQPVIRSARTVLLGATRP